MEMGGAMKASDDPLELEPVLAALPVSFNALRAADLAEGFPQAERLASDWEAGRTRSLSVRAPLQLPSKGNRRTIGASRFALSSHRSSMVYQ
jgi:hypothetical protein